MPSIEDPSVTANVPRILRHDFRTGNAAEAIAPIVKSTQEVLDEFETSADYRYEAQMLTLAVAKWRCLTDPMPGSSRPGKRGRQVRDVIQVLREMGGPRP
jgi:hypothetical protein